MAVSLTKLNFLVECGAYHDLLGTQRLQFGTPNDFQIVLAKLQQHLAGIGERQLNNWPRWDCARKTALYLGAESIPHWTT